MVTGIKSGGTDLDSLLEPRTTTKIDDVNIKSNGGVDISNRFEDIASGTGPSSLGISRTSGITVDLSLLFAGIGTVAEDVITLTNMDAFFEDDFDVAARCQLYGESHAREGEQWHNDGGFNLVFQNDTITPASSTDDYQMKWVALGGDIPSFKSVAENTWESLDLDTFYVEWQADFDETSQGSVTVSIRKGTGSVIDTAIWSGEAIAYKKT